MIQQVISLAIMALALICAASSACSRTSGARKWALTAFLFTFVYGAATNIVPYCSTIVFMPAKALELIAFTIAAFSYMLSLAEACGAVVVRPIRYMVSAVTAIYIAIMGTMHMHGLCFTNIKFNPGASEGTFEASYKSEILFYVASACVIAVILVLAIVALKARPKSAIKAPVGLNFIVVLSLLVMIGAAVGEMILNNWIITAVAIALLDIILLIAIGKYDRSDIVDFGKSCSVDSTNDGVIILDHRMNFLFANKTARRLFFELSERDHDAVTKFVATISDKKSIQRGDHTYELAKGNYTDYNGNRDCVIIMIHDITEQELRATRLSDEEAIDSITGLSSRSSVIAELTEVCQLKNGTLLHINFDGLKAINNLYGHEEANKLLASFGKILKNNTNNDDIRGKLGGELFTVFLKECSSESVIANLTMRLEEQITDALHNQLGKSVDVTVGISVGAAIVPQCGRDYEKLAELADKELNKIKSSGGHGYSVCEEGASSSFSDEFTEITQEPAVIETIPEDDDTN